MNESLVSTRYAKSLFLFATENKVENKVYDDVKSIYSACCEISEFMDFLQNPVITTSNKKLFIQKLLSGKISSHTLNFLNITIENKRESYLKEITRDFIELYKKHIGIKTVTLTTAEGLSDKQKSEFLKQLKSTFKTEIEFTEVTDKNIIGGVILRMDDLQYDASIATKLNEVKKSLSQAQIK
ncbi:MAG: ATP synthase F1 subunit delta [Bacteroidales bacterium]